MTTHFDPYQSKLLGKTFRWVGPEQTYYEHLFVTDGNYFLLKKLSTTYLIPTDYNESEWDGRWKGEVESVQLNLRRAQAIEWLQTKGKVQLGPQIKLFPDDSSESFTVEFEVTERGEMEKASEAYWPTQTDAAEECPF